MTAGPSVVCKPVPIVWIFASASGRFLSVLACHPAGSVPPPAIFASGSRSCATTPAATPNHSSVEKAAVNRVAGIGTKAPPNGKGGRGDPPTGPLFKNKEKLKEPTKKT